MPVFNSDKTPGATKVSKTQNVPDSPLPGRMSGSPPQVEGDYGSGPVQTPGAGYTNNQRASTRDHEPPQGPK